MGREFLRLTGEPERLAIALGARHAGVAGHRVLEVQSLVVRDHGDGPFSEEGDAAEDRAVVAAGTVPVQFVKAVKDLVDDLDGAGSRLVARAAHEGPRVARGEPPFDLFPDGLKLTREVDPVGAGLPSELRDALLDPDPALHAAPPARWARSMRERNARCSDRGTMLSTNPRASCRSAL